MYEFETLQQPCPNCGGILEYWSVSPDCGWSPGSSGIQCRTCHKEFTGKDLEEEVKENERKDNGQVKPDEVKKLNRSEKNKLLSLLYSGIFFGFDPPSLEQLEERMNCQTCVAIAEKMKQLNEMQTPIYWKFLFPKLIGSMWQNKNNVLILKLLSEAKDLAIRDKAHWDSEVDKLISNEFVKAFIKSENWKT